MHTRDKAVFSLVDIQKTVEKENYWHQELSGDLPDTNFPFSGLRPAQVETQVLEFSIPDDLVVQLVKISKNSELSLYLILLTALKSVLYRYNGQEDNIIGSPVYKPTTTEETSNNLVLVRTHIVGELSFKELLLQVKDKTLKAYEHQNYSFSELLKNLGIKESERLPRIICLFKNIHNVDSLAGVARDVTVVFSYEHAAIRCQVIYHTLLFERKLIKRFSEHFINVLACAVADINTPISKLKLLSRSEEHQLLIEFNNTCTEYPDEKTIVSLFEEQVEKTPEAIAVVFKGQQLSYQILNQRANQLAHYLHTLKVGPEVLVGLYIERSLEMIIGLLGILKAGGAYVPLDPAYPKKRLDFMLEDSQVRVLLTTQKLVEGLPNKIAEFVCLDALDATLSRFNTNNPVSGVKPSNLVYVIYTSGSTGIPKGVMIQHQSLVNFVETAIVEYELTERDHILQFASISFDAAAEEIYPCLACGGRLVLRFDEMLNSMPTFLKHCMELELTVLDLPTAFWHQLNFELAPTKAKLPDSLRLVIIGGERALSEPVNLWQQWIGTNPLLVNSYGPTETTVVATMYQLSSSGLLQKEWGNIPIGHAIRNVQTYVLDKYLQLVPIGIQGELHIGGAGLARGYLNRPDLTKEKFIKNPFSEAPDSRLYKTGDLVRYLFDGNIEYLERIDDQVKIRGFRIELGEIEQTLLKHSVIKQASVTTRHTKSDNQELVAYLVCQEALNVAEIKNYLAQTLPDYMIPAYFVSLEKLPLTANGKIDKEVLPDPLESRLSLATEYNAPCNKLEKQLVSIWEAILGREQIGIEDNFFELGGHSIKATQLATRVHNTLKVEISLRDIFDSPTIASLAAQIESARFAPSNAPSIEVISREEKLPLSFAQQRLWFLDQLEGKGVTYNIPVALRLTGSLHLTALEQSLTEIVQRHESLRTCFPMVDENPIQVINPTPPPHLVVKDLQHLSGKEKTTVIQRLVSEEAQRPFDLVRGPLFRAILWKLNEEEHVLLINMHHIISDAWSINIFFNELSTLYEAFSQGNPSPLPTLSIQYADFAHWQRQWLSGEALEEQLNYWKQQLAGVPPLLELPTDRPRPPVQRFRGANKPLQITSELTEQLKALSQQSGTTLFMTLLSAFAALLSRYTGHNDIVIGSPIANRTHSQIESLIGFFVNTLVLRIDLSGRPRFDELLRRVRRVALDAYAHQYIPFEQVVKELRPERNLSYSPLIQVVFVLQNVPTDALQLSGLTITPIVPENVTAKFDIILSMNGTAQGLKGTLEYNTDLFEEATITRMLGHLQTLLEGIVKNPQQSVAQLPLLTAEEYQQLLAWNDTASNYPVEQCIHQLFETQVAKTPDAIAIVFEAQQLTYQELNRKANQVAHYLQTLGVKPEVLVALCIERSLEMVIGLLGILKAGGAYLPLEPTYPKARLAFMLEDAQVSVLLTQEKWINSLPAHQATVVCLDTLSTTLSQFSTDNPSNDIKSENLAYVMYTSGSTGQPKGITVIHRGVVRLVKETHYINLMADEVFLQFAPISFDASTFEIWGSLLNGAKLIVMSPDTSSLETLGHIIKQYQVTTLWLTASLFNLMVDERLTDLKPVRQLLIGGEALSVPHVRKALQALKCQLINGYGPTENTTFTCCCAITEDKIGTSVPVGRPIANTQIYILDTHLQLVPIGVTGELHIGGAGLARGYLNRPDLTAEKFIPNPFSDDPDSRLYKTGDLARYLPDGNIDYLGRLDNQVKIRGFRIELGEIETVLTQHPTVQECAVTAYEESLHDKRLVAYLVPKPEKVIDDIELRGFLKERLPSYMAPSALVSLDALPLTPNGKVDRQVLSQWSVNHEVSEETFVAPRNVLESQLTKIWEKILKTRPIGIHDNFFDLGGHSLLAVTLLSRIEKELGKSLSLRALFQAPSIAQQAKILRRDNNHIVSSRRALEVIQPQGSCLPFFVMGNSRLARAISPFLGTNQPVYGLNIIHFQPSDSNIPVSDIKELAKLSIQEIQMVQPKGPYYLGGYCLDAPVTFEIAQQLHAQEQQVALLALFDAFIDIAWESQKGYSLQHHWLNLLELGPNYLSKKIQKKWERLFRLSRLKFLSQLGKKVSQNHNKQFFLSNQIEYSLFEKSYRERVAGYVPQPYLGHLTLFLASEWRLKHSSAFEHLAIKGVTICEIPGYHDELFISPQVEILGQQLKQCLEKAQASCD